MDPSRISTDPRWISTDPRRISTDPRLKWASEPTWEHILEQDYSNHFDRCCNHYPHYLDTVLDGLEVIKVKDKRREEIYLPILSTGGVYNDATVNPEIFAYTALDDDLFLPRGIYNSDKGVPIIFDSGCTHAVTPFKEDL